LAQPESAGEKSSLKNLPESPQRDVGPLDRVDKNHMESTQGTTHAGSAAGTKEVAPHYGKPIFLTPGHGRHLFFFTMPDLFIRAQASACIKDALFLSAWIPYFF